MTGRRGEVVRASAASVILAVVVVGVPVALVTAIGWPLPRGVPAWSDMRRALETGDIADDVWLKAIACVVWAAWAQFTLAVSVEARAALRGAMARPLPGVPAAAQLAAARLVTTIAVVVAATGARPAHAAAPVPVAQVLAAAHPTTAVLSVETDVAPPPRPVPDETRSKTWTVQRKDSLWSIAQRTLGSGERAGEIFELNKGRLQPDGRSLVQAHDIEPGWVLTLPPDAVVAASPPTGEYTVKPGDTLSEIADDVLGDGDRYPHLFELNKGRPQQDGRTLTDPDLIRPGWVLRMPAPGGSDGATAAVEGAIAAPGPPPAEPERQIPTPASEPSATTPESPPSTVVPIAPDATPAPTSAPQVPPSVAEPVAPVDGSSDGPAPDDEEEGVSVRALVGVGLMLAGVAATIDRLRRVQQRRRRSGRRILVPEPGSEAEERETRLRGGAEVDVAAAVDVALRRITERSASSTKAARILSAHVDRTAVVLRVEGADEPPPGFERADGAWRMRLDEVQQAPVAPSSAPALVSLGVDDRGHVLVDLESAAVLAVAGDHHGVRGFTDALAVALGCAPWSDDAEILLVGVDVNPMLPWVRRVDSLDEAIAAAEARLVEVAAALRYAEVATTLAGRMNGITTEAWEPLVVVSGVEPDEAQSARLAALAAAPNCGVVVVVPGVVHGVEWQAHLSADGRLELPVVDLAVDATWASAEVAATASELLELAADADDVPALSPEQNSNYRPPDPSAITAVPADVEVRLLGEVDIIRANGEPVAFERSKSAEAVAYLAVHPEGVTKDPLQFALWPDGDNAEGTWHHTISKARRNLGDDENGEPLFPPVSATGGIYRLAARVGTDYRRFQQLVAEARSAPTGEARPLLEQALGLVRGEPLMARGPGYAWRAGLAATIEAEVVDAAEWLGDLCLEASDPRGCEWAARRGLLASPYDERLYRLLMRAADSAGNTAGVHKVLEELAAKLELDVEPLDGVHPETVALFEELTARRGRVSA